MTREAQGFANIPRMRSITMAVAPLVLMNASLTHGLRWRAARRRACRARVEVTWAKYGAFLLAMLLTAACGAPNHAAPNGKPVTSSDAAAHTAIEQGRVEFERRWVPYPSIGGQWGRGPLSSADSCAGCHPGNGRGRLTSGDDDPGAVLRIGLGDHALPDPRYGRQLDRDGLLGRVPGEGRLHLQWRQRRVTLGDGEVVTLRQPVPHIIDAAYGELSATAVVSVRIAPALHGLGLLESIDDDELRRLHAASHRNGVRGMLNRVPDLERGDTRTGRFGWKASQPTLAQQSATAFLDDIGVSTSLFPADQCSAAQSACRATETVPHPEAKPLQLAALTAYLRALPAPPPPAPDRRGQALFQDLHCDACHVERLRTPRPEAPFIQPYTDLLLHDMGEPLSDALREFDATGAQWRTAPLWGLSRITPDADGLRLLHDGRARDVQEAILWHAGEAEPMRAAYARLSRAERAILLRFLQSL